VGDRFPEKKGAPMNDCGDSRTLEQPGGLCRLADLDDFIAGSLTNIAS